MTVINGDLIPALSGASHLGVNGNAVGAFDITTLKPFGHIAQLSGIFCDPLTGQSGVLRFAQAQAAFQISVDGGRTFTNLSAGGVDSIGVIGGVNPLTGNVSVASQASGFIAIYDTGLAGSPLFWAVDNLGLSGLWGFPTQGFNGRVVNALTDTNGTEAQGVIQVAGVSGIIADIVGNVLSIAPGNSVPRCFSNTFASSTSWTISHNLNSASVVVQVFDANSPRNLINPDEIIITDVNTVTVRWNSAQDGLAVVFACY